MYLAFIEVDCGHFAERQSGNSNKLVLQESQQVGGTICTGVAKELNQGPIRSKFNAIAGQSMI